MLRGKQKKKTKYATDINKILYLHTFHGVFCSNLEYSSGCSRFAFVCFFAAAIVPNRSSRSRVDSVGFLCTLQELIDSHSAQSAFALDACFTWRIRNAYCVYAAYLHCKLPQKRV